MMWWGVRGNGLGVLSPDPCCRHKPHTNQSHVHRNLLLFGCIASRSPGSSSLFSPGFRTLWSQPEQLFTSVALSAGRLSIPEVARC